MFEVDFNYVTAGDELNVHFVFLYNSFEGKITNKS